MADTQITAYSDQYYFTRPDILNTDLHFSGVLEFLRYFHMP